MISPLMLVQKLSADSATTAEIWDISKFCLQIGRLNQSLTIAYSVVQKDPDQQQLYRERYIESVRLGAEFAEEIGDYHRAAYYWEQLTKQLPQEITGWHGLGVAKANLQDYRGAEIALNRCLQLQPGNQQVRSHLAKIQQLLQS